MDLFGNFIKVGDSWIIRRKGATTLVTVKVTDVTERTVEIRESGYASRAERYEKGYIEFIEKV